MKVPGFDAELALASDKSQGRYAGSVVQNVLGEVQPAFGCRECFLAGGDCLCSGTRCFCV
jgi:hypothetical protein